MRAGSRTAFGTESRSKYTSLCGFLSFRLIDRKVRVSSSSSTIIYGMSRSPAETNKERDGRCDVERREARSKVRRILDRHNVLRLNLQSVSSNR